MGKPPANTAVRFWRDPDLPGLEVRWSSYRADAFRDHVHAAYSVGFLESGGTTFCLGGAAHRAVTGQLVLIPPRAVHACNPDPGGDLTYCMCYVDPPLATAVAAEVFGPEAGSPVFPAPVVDDPDLVARWRGLYRAVAQGADRLEKESLLLEGLAVLLERHAVSSGPRPLPAAGDAVRAVCGHLAADPSAPASLDALARVAGLSRCHLLRVFREAVGMPPHAYHNQLRVDLAKTLLARGLDLSRVAAEAGFADQSHFTRVFRQYTGATPDQYRAS